MRPAEHLEAHLRGDSSKRAKSQTHLEVDLPAREEGTCRIDMNLAGRSIENVPFNVSQVIALKWLPVLPGLLSILGSTLIAQRVIRSKKLRSKSYERLMLGLSSVDILNSVRLIIFPTIFHPFTEPSVACTVEGFIVSLSLAGPMYNAVLSVYYFLVVVYGVSNQRISQRYEAWLHAIPFAYGIAGAFLGLGMGVFNPKQDNIMCYVAEWPHRCSGDECDRGALATVYEYVAVLVPLTMILMVLVGANAAIYMKVRRVLKKTEKYTSHPCTPSRFSSSASELRRDEDIEEESHPHVQPPPRAVQSGTNRQSSSSAKTQKVAVQSILYVLAYLLCFGWSVIVSVAAWIVPDRIERGDFFPLSVLEMIFFPAQGLFNAFVYARPTYLRLRNEESDLSRWHCFRKALLDPPE